MANLRLVGLVFAFVCFVLAVFSAEPRKQQLIAAGLACWVATEFLV